MSNLAKGRVRIKCNSSVLVQNIFSFLYSNSIFNLYLVSELNNCPHNTANYITLKNCLFSTVKLIRNVIKCKFVYNGRGKAFDEVGS